MMGKLELVILGASLFVAASGLTLPSLHFFGNEADGSKFESIEDDGKSVPEKHHEENTFSTLHLPGLPGIPLPPMPPVPAFLQRPVVKATKTVIIEMTHYEKTHPVCWTVDPHKPPCDNHDQHHHYEEVVINPTSTVHIIKPSAAYPSHPLAALEEVLRPLKPTIEKPVSEPSAESSSHHLESSEPEKTEDHHAAAESREGRYIQFGTPVVSAGDEVRINDAPQENEAVIDDEKDSRIIGKLKFRPNTIYETKTIYATKTEKVPDHMTATLIIDNCVPVDSSIPKCGSHPHVPSPSPSHTSQPLIDNYGQNYEQHFVDEVVVDDHDNIEKGHLGFLKKLIAQQAALAEGGAHYAAQIAAQHAAYHAALAHRFHSTAAQIAQNNANNALAAENAALEAAHHHQEAEHAAHENLVSILKKYTKRGQYLEQTSSTAETPKAAAPADNTDEHWRIVAENEDSE